MGNGFATPSANQLNDMFKVKYGWSEASTPIHESIIGSSVVAGMAIGAFSGGKLMVHGRRRAMIISSLIGLVGVALTLIENFYVLNIGRLVFGFTSGCQAAVVVRMIDEYMPPRLTSTAMGGFAATQNFSAFLALCSGLILPHSYETEQLESNEIWRVIFLFPALMYVIIIAGFLLIIRTDSPKYYVAKSDRQNAIKAIHATFKT